MKVRITPHTLRGKIEAVSSKSYLHRMILCAALSESDTVIRLNCRSKDVEATVRCAEALGARIWIGEDRLTVRPVGKKSGGAESAVLAEQMPVFDCGESGSTARFILPLAAAVLGRGRLTGEGRLPERPFDEICRVMEENGCRFSSHRLPMEVRGKLRAGIYRIPANISSQYISALMMSLPLADGESEIVFTTEVESEGYLEITESVMRGFGMPLERTGSGYRVAGNRRYRSPGEVRAEGDWSNGAFWEAANALGCELEIGGLRADSLQRDSRIREVVRLLRTADGGTVTVDGADIPDIIPIAAVTACGRKGRTRFVRCGRLRLKESDRLESTVRMIRSLGGSADAEGDTLTVDGSGRLAGGTVDACGDHRIVMSAAVAAVICEGDVVIDGAENAAKSYPAFFEDYRRLGGICRRE